MDQNQINSLKNLIQDLEKSLFNLRNFLDTQNLSNNAGDINTVLQPSKSLQKDNPINFSDAPVLPKEVLSKPASSAISTFDAPLKPSVPVAKDPSLQKLAFAQATGKNLNSTQPAGNLPVTNNISQTKPQDYVEGKFDGKFIVTPDDQKIEVPTSYAAKTRILYDDIVSKFTEDGVVKFKVIQKQPRKQIKALTTKRDGKWYVLTGIGSYKISDENADFLQLSVNQEVYVLIPENNINVPFAAFDDVVQAQKDSVQSDSIVQSVKQPVQFARPVQSQNIVQQQSRVLNVQSGLSPKSDMPTQSTQNNQSTPTSQPTQSAQTVQNITSTVLDDDLV